MFVAETAQMLARNVNYEIPALKKQIAKCQQIQKVYYVLTFPTHNFPKNSICTLSMIHANISAMKKWPYTRGDLS